MNYVTKTMTISVITNIFLAVTKILVGITAKSSALIADGIHSFSDLSTDFFAILGNYLARKPADKEHPFGHGKIEYLTSIIIGIVVFFVGIGVIINAFNNEVVIPSKVVILVSLMTIIAKYLLSSFVIKKGVDNQNNILIASGAESRTDVISSFFVLIASILIQFSDTFEFLKYSDIVASIVVGLFIVYTGYNVVRENISVILGKQENNKEYLANLKKIILEDDNVYSIRSMVILKFGHVVTLDLIIIMNGEISLRDAHKIVDVIEASIKKYDARVEHINIHMEPNRQLTNKKKKVKIQSINQWRRLVQSVIINRGLVVGGNKNKTFVNLLLREM